MGQLSILPPELGYEVVQRGARGWMLPHPHHVAVHAVPDLGVQAVVDGHVEVVPERVLHLHHVGEHRRLEVVEDVQLARVAVPGAGQVRRVVYDVPLVKHQGVKLRRAREMLSEVGQ